MAAAGAASDASASASAAGAAGYAGTLQAQVQMGIAAAQLLSQGAALPPLGANMPPLLHQLPPPAASSETSPVQDHGRGARSVITLCIEGNVTAFDANRLRKLRKVLAEELADEMRPEHVEIKPLRVLGSGVQAQIGTARCSIRVHVDLNGFAEFDSSSSESSDADSQPSDEDRLVQVQRDVEHVIRSKHWPSVVVEGDIKVFCILPGSVLLVLLLPTAAAHVLFQLYQQGVAALTAEGVRCCKLRGQVVRCDAALGIEDHAQSMHAAALCEAEQAAAQTASSQPVLPPTSSP